MQASLTEAWSCIATTKVVTQRNILLENTPVELHASRLAHIDRQRVGRPRARRSRYIADSGLGLCTLDETVLRGGKCGRATHNMDSELQAHRVDLRSDGTETCAVPTRGPAFWVRLGAAVVIEQPFARGRCLIPEIVDDAGVVPVFTYA